MSQSWRHIVLVTFFSLLVLPFLGSEGKPRHKRSGNGTRINFGTALSFYTINEKHGELPKQKLNFLGGIRRELRVTRDYRTYILIGMDYFIHGLTYNSYYFKPDSVKLYNKRFNYKYSVVLNEVQFPIQLKFLLRREDNSPFSPYYLIGYHFRCMLPANVKVYEKDKLVKDDSPDVVFKNYLISEKVNASVSGSLGWQINNLSDYKGSFFAELNFQYGFSDYYFNTNYSAASMYINAMHVTFLCGFKF